MFLTAVVVMGAALAVGQPKVSPPTQKGDKFSIDASKTTQTLKKGDKGQFVLEILASPGFKVSQDAPLKVKLASDGLALTKTSLKAKDAKPRKFTSPTFKVPFTARSPGQTSIAMNAMFFVCDVEICERKTAQLSVPVSVRP